jgi:hypothetical protein
MENMTNRERMLCVLARKRPDRIPWIPRLAPWHSHHVREGTIPKRYAGMTLREVEHAIGCGTPARGGKIFRERLENVEVVITKKGNDTFKEYRTPVGTLTSHEHITPELARAGLAGRHQKYLVEGPADYKIYEYVVEHTYYEPTYEAYLDYEREIGDDGYPLIVAGDDPYIRFLLRLAGYNNAYLQLADHTSEIEHMLTVMAQVDRERLWPVMANSPALFINHGTHYDSQMTPPPIFRKYITPYYQELSALLHARGKILAYHGDSDNRLLVPLIPEAGFDLAECFTTWPMGKLTVKEAYHAWAPTRTIIWGGIPSVLFGPSYSDQDFERYMDDLFKSIAPGDNFILGIADDLLPDHKIERVERVTQMVSERGKLPLAC